MYKGRKIFFAAISANIVEYYDFTSFTLFIPVISSYFFPENKSMLPLLAFAVGFITRPIGGVVFGYLGDVFGRRVALIVSSFGMSLATLFIGMLPTYQSVGIVSMLLLMLMRLIQGLCISGEGTGTAIFLLEHFTKNKPGFITSITQSASILGILIASALTLLLSIVANKINLLHGNSIIDDIVKMRIVFIVGGVLGLIALYFRSKISETPIFRKIQRAKQNNSGITHVISTQWPQMLLTFIVAAGASSILQFLKGYLSTHCILVLQLPLFVTHIYITYVSIVLIVATVFAGYLLDKFLGVVRMIFFSSILIVVFAFPSMLFICSFNVVYNLLGLTLLSTLAALICVPAYVFSISLFRPENRFLGVSFSYNLGIAIFGGTVPLIARGLVYYTCKNYAPILYLLLMFTSLIAGMLLMRRYYVQGKRFL